MNISENQRQMLPHFNLNKKPCRLLLFFSLAHCNLSHRFSPPVMAIRQDSWCDTMSLWSISTSWWQLAVPVHLYNLSGGFKYLYFLPLPGEMIQFDEHMFQVGWFNHQTS